VHEFGGRGWGYIDRIFKKLRKRMRIKEVLALDLAGDQKQKPVPRQGNFPFMICGYGRKTPMTPDYWEWGIK